MAKRNLANTLKSLGEVFASATRYLAMRLRKRGHSSSKILAERSLLDAIKATPRLAAAIETRFKASAQVLESLKNDSDKVVETSKRLVVIATGQEAGKDALLMGMQLVAQPLDLLADCHAESEDLYKRLKDYQARIQLLQGKEAEIRTAMAPLKSMQALMKIEAATLTSDAQAMFNALSIEIERLQGQMRELFETKFLELLRVDEVLKTVCSGLQRTAPRLRNFVESEKKRIDESLARLRTALEQNEGREARLTRLSEEISAIAKSALQGLQMEEIVALHFNSIQQSLESTQQVFNSGNKGKSFPDPSRLLRASQIAALREALLVAQNDARRGMHSLIEKMARADRECLSLGEFDFITTSADGMVQLLLDDIEAVSAQVKYASEGASEAHTALSPISGLATGVTTTVLDLSHNIHLIGLNAQIQAAQFSEGAGLAVISFRMSEISRTTSELSRTIASELDDIATGLTESVSKLKKIQDRARQQADTTSSEGTTVESFLHQLRDSAFQCVDEIARLLENITLSTGTVMDTVDYNEQAEPALKELEGCVEALHRYFNLSLDPTQTTTELPSSADGGESRLLDGAAPAETASNPQPFNGFRSVETADKIRNATVELS